MFMLPDGFRVPWASFFRAFEVVLRCFIEICVRKFMHRNIYKCLCYLMGLEFPGHRFFELSRFSQKRGSRRVAGLLRRRGVRPLKHSIA